MNWTLAAAGAALTVLLHLHLTVAAAGATVTVSLPWVVIAALITAIAVLAWLIVRQVRGFKSSPWPRPVSTWSTT